MKARIIRNVLMTTIGISMLPGLPAEAAVISVPADQPTIQAAIVAAVDSDEVVVAQGEYFEQIDFSGKAITVRSTNPDNPAIVVTTIINGGGTGTVVTCASGEGSDTVLNGFVITNGDSPGGGGMLNQESSPTVSNCTFSGNSAALGYGGGMYNNLSSPTVSNCRFSGNTADLFGGGIYNNGDSSPTVSNCTFSGNSATVGYGGGICSEDSTIALLNCTLSDNTAGLFGGGMYNGNSSATVSNCTFSGNTATVGNGGGMYNSLSDPMVSNCTFSGNLTWMHGGGMCNEESSPAVSNCLFSENSAVSGCGGGMCNVLPSAPVITDTIFCKNTPDIICGSFTDNRDNVFSNRFCPPPKAPESFCNGDLTGDGWLLF